VTVLSALPILVPLVGVPVCFLPLYPLFGRLSRRAVYAVLLSGTALSLLLVWSSSSSAVIPVPSDAGYLPSAAVPLWSPLSYWAGTLVLIVLLIGQLTEAGHPLSAAHATSSLLTLACTMGAISAANTISLLLAWSVPQWLRMYVEFSEHTEPQRPAHTDAWASYGSIALALLGAIAAVAEQDGTLYLVEIRPGLAFACLGMAVALRLFALVQATRESRWSGLDTMSLMTSLYLWLRLGVALKADTALLSTPIPMVAVGLAVGLYLGRREAQSLRIPIQLGYWLSLAMLAPLLDPGRGFSVAFLITTQLMLCSVILLTTPSSGGGDRCSRVPTCVARAAMSGVIGSSGFIAYWVFGQICLQAGGLALLGLAAIGYFVAAMPLARRLTRPGNALEAPTGETDCRRCLPLYGVGAILVLLGLWPGLLDRVFPDVRIGLDALNYAQLWGTGAAERFSVLAAALLVPAGTVAVNRRAPTILDEVQRGILRLESGLKVRWLYLLAQRLLARVAAAMQAVLTTIEESLPLGWCLLWCIALAYYLIQR